MYLIRHTLSSTETFWARWGRELGVGRRVEDDGKFRLPGVPSALPLFPFPSLPTTSYTVKAAQKKPQQRNESDIIIRKV